MSRISCLGTLISVWELDTCARAKVRGPHGFGALNDAGKEFLSFLSVNEATLCNTWFKKRDQ